MVIIVFTLIASIISILGIDARSPTRGIYWEPGCHSWDVPCSRGNSTISDFLLPTPDITIAEGVVAASTNEDIEERGFLYYISPQCPPRDATYALIHELIIADGFKPECVSSALLREKLSARGVLYAISSLPALTQGRRPLLLPAALDPQRGPFAEALSYAIQRGYDPLCASCVAPFACKVIVADRTPDVPPPECNENTRLVDGLAFVQRGKSRMASAFIGDVVAAIRSLEFVHSPSITPTVSVTSSPTNALATRSPVPQISCFTASGIACNRNTGSCVDVSKACSSITECSVLPKRICKHLLSPCNWERATRTCTTNKSSAMQRELRAVFPKQHKKQQRYVANARGIRRPRHLNSTRRLTQPSEYEPEYDSPQLDDDDERQPDNDNDRRLREYELLRTAEYELHHQR